MTDKEPLKITLDDLEAEEAPAKPEAARGKLQEQAEAHLDQLGPPPMRGVAELHRQLLSRDSQ